MSEPVLSELALCQRELTFQRAKLDEAQRKFDVQQRQRQEELTEMQAELRHLAESTLATYGAHRQEDRELQRALQSSRRQLKEMCSEFHRAQELRVRRAKAAKDEAGQRAAQQQQRQQFEARECLKAEILSMRTELELQADTRDLLELQAAAAEAALHDRRRILADYEQRARELHEELRHVLRQLQVSHEGAQEEQKRLEEHLASFEGWLPEPPGAALRMLETRKSLLQEPLTVTAESTWHPMSSVVKVRDVTASPSIRSRDSELLTAAKGHAVPGALLLAEGGYGEPLPLAAEDEGWVK
eukprot:TRINITY_DN62652_c0_g1_i1.p1 TRINITY_DN62652_c0_g1~~TRINITY_DN62652_c0_g1_i1.p1  ORF type:complete len:300 (+),score=88.68 TRINITY_DN62652_c0_g1_i1:45-944(+)